jgi:hypothetical protein
VNLITVTREGITAPPVLTVYSDGKPVVAVAISQREAINLIRDIAKEAFP